MLFNSLVALTALSRVGAEFVSTYADFTIVLVTLEIKESRAGLRPARGAGLSACAPGPVSPVQRVAVDQGDRVR